MFVSGFKNFSGVSFMSEPQPNFWHAKLMVGLGNIARGQGTYGERIFQRLPDAQVSATLIDCADRKDWNGVKSLLKNLVFGLNDMPFGQLVRSAIKDNRHDMIDVMFGHMGRADGPFGPLRGHENHPNRSLVFWGEKAVLMAYAENNVEAGRAVSEAASKHIALQGRSSESNLFLNRVIRQAMLYPDHPVVVNGQNAARLDLVDFALCCGANPAIFSADAIRKEDSEMLGLFIRHGVLDRQQHKEGLQHITHLEMEREMRGRNSADVTKKLTGIMDMLGMDGSKIKQELENEIVAERAQRQEAQANFKGYLNFAPS